MEDQNLGKQNMDIANIIVTVIFNLPEHRDTINYIGFIIEKEKSQQFLN